jgi:hypothetical protein
MSIEKDAEIRVNWIEKRISLSNEQKAYFKFQMKELALEKERNQRQLLIDFGMSGLFDQKSEQNKKFVTARVDSFLKTLKN